jgi:glycosyltransferase involved in cell wall biosynthesis
MDNETSEARWICCQRGAREHYGIPRVLHKRGVLECLLTDWWWPPGGNWGAGSLVRRLRDRFHPDLRHARVRAFHGSMVIAELQSRIARSSWYGHQQILNRRFEKSCVRELKSLPRTTAPRTIFAFSYAAKEILRFARNRNWKTVLGQIDPGPRESEIVTKEYKRLGLPISPLYKPVAGYWDDWRQECELADWIVINSAWSAKCLAEEGIPAKKLRLVPCTFEAPKWAATFRRMYPAAFSRDRPLEVLFLGQTTIRKGIHLLMQAAALLIDEPVRFTVVGTGLDYPGLSIPGNVRWIGAVPRHQINRWYENSDVFALPTLSDGFALTQLEAMAWALPVISTVRCGDVVENGVNGIVLKEITSDALAEALGRLIQSPAELERMSKESRVGDRFSLASVGDKLLECVR